MKITTAEQILDIYKRRKQFHDGFDDIAEKTGVKVPNVIYNNFVLMIEGKKEPKTRNYKEALALFRVEEEEKQKQKAKEIEEKKRLCVPTSEGQTPSFFSFVLKGIENGINAFVDARVEGKIGKVSEEYRKIAEENAQIRKVLEEAKVGNWGVELQKQLNK